LLAPPAPLVLVPSSLTQEPIDLFVELVQEQLPMTPPAPAAAAEKRLGLHRRGASEGVPGAFAEAAALHMSTFRLGAKMGDLRLKFERGSKARADEASPFTAGNKKTPAKPAAPFVAVSEGPVHKQCRVSVRARSGFSLVDVDSPGRTEVVHVSAVFSREFLLAGEWATVALNQGRVVLSIDRTSDLAPFSPAAGQPGSPDIVRAVSSSGSVVHYDDDDDDDDGDAASEDVSQNSVVGDVEAEATSVEGSA